MIDECVMPNGTTSSALEVKGGEAANRPEHQRHHAGDAKDREEELVRASDWA